MPPVPPVAFPHHPLHAISKRGVVSGGRTHDTNLMGDGMSVVHKASLPPGRNPAQQLAGSQPPTFSLPPALLPFFPRRMDPPSRQERSHTERRALRGSGARRRRWCCTCCTPRRLAGAPRPPPRRAPSWTPWARAPCCGESRAVMPIAALPRTVGILPGKPLDRS